MTEKTLDKSIHLAEIDLAESATDQTVSAAGSQVPVSESPQAEPHQPGQTEERPGGAWLIWLANSFALLWVGGATAFIWGALGVQSLERLGQYGFGQLTGLAVFAIAPALLFIMSGLMAREVVRNAHNTRRVERAIRRLSEPAQYARHEVQSLSQAVTGEVDRINSALESALARLAAMEEVISHHAESLELSATDARDRTEELLKGLRKERLRLGEVSESFDDKAALIAAAISDQSKMVAAAAELAANQASDSGRRILASVESLQDAGDSVTERSNIAATKLSERTAHLHELADTLKERTDNLDAAYVKHRGRLSEAGEALRKEQEKIAAALDFHRAELDVMATTARDGADALTSASTDGAAAFKKSVDEALERAHSLAGRVRSESEYAAREHEAALARLIASAQEAKSISQAAIEAIEAQADAVTQKVEHSNEIAFNAAQRSDDAFQQRLAEADKLTARASQVADEAAESVRRRLEAVLASARVETQTVERHIDSMTDRLAELPVMARERAQEAADALRRGLEGLNAAAMVAAEESQEIDAAFQARIRQNYELLSDFMLRMGSVAGGRRVPDLGTNELPDPLLGRKRKSADSEDAKAESAEVSDEMHTPLTGPQPRRAAPRGAENSVGFPERGARQTGEPGWRWKDLLSSMPAEGEADSADGDTAAAKRPAKRDKGDS
ncbi:coiled-coil domain-containing protein [Maricaulis salignorans]|uniref:Uncharacterized protein n=1 Tax=Maricaulis salignorans TaxID=144026 RepID=A0A1G9S9G3_9PROT|nr:hypothetical protein [Maricaulis salignorans]SDM32109.1 hypothetical protein SAMN04488568_1098 [Maricaulis salignorans]